MQRVFGMVAFAIYTKIAFHADRNCPPNYKFLRTDSVIIQPWMPMRSAVEHLATDPKVIWAWSPGRRTYLTALRRKSFAFIASWRKIDV